MHYLFMLNLSRERRFKLGCKGGDKLKNGNDTKIIVFVPRKLYLQRSGGNICSGMLTLILIPIGNDNLLA